MYARRLPAMSETRKTAALVSAYYPAHGGGIEIVSAKLAAGLAGNGWDIEWLALDKEPPESGSVLRITPVAGTDAIYRKAGIPFPLIGMSGLSRLLAAIRRAQVCLLADANFVITVVAFIIARVFRRPVLLVQHVGAPSTNSRAAAGIMWLAEMLFVRPMIRRSEGVVFVSPVVADHFCTLATRRRAEVIGHGLDPELFRPAEAEEKLLLRKKLGFSESGPIACFVGRTTVTKGIGIFAKIAELRSDWQFVVAGEGPIDPADFDLPNLIALGALAQTELADVYRCCDLLILPSQSESFSLVVREALASGIRVLCGDQLVQTDPRLAPFLTIRPVDLDRDDETAQVFAHALDQMPGRPVQEARNYLIENCSWHAVFKAYGEMLGRILEDKRQIR